MGGRGPDNDFSHQRISKRSVWTGSNWGPDCFSREVRSRISKEPIATGDFPWGGGVDPKNSNKMLNHP